MAATPRRRLVDAMPSSRVPLRCFSGGVAPPSHPATRASQPLETHEFAQRYNAFAAAAGPVPMAEGARCFDGHWRDTVGDWRQDVSKGIWLFLAAGVHVLPEP